MFKYIQYIDYIPPFPLASHYAGLKTKYLTLGDT